MSRKNAVKNKDSTTVEKKQGETFSISLMKTVQKRQNECHE